MSRGNVKFDRRNIQTLRACQWWYVRQLKIHSWDHMMYTSRGDIVYFCKFWWLRGRGRPDQQSDIDHWLWSVDWDIGTIPADVIPVCHLQSNKRRLEMINETEAIAQSWILYQLQNHTYTKGLVSNVDVSTSTFDSQGSMRIIRVIHNKRTSETITVLSLC